MGFTISTLEYPGEFKKKLINKMDCLDSDKINIDIKENQKDDYTLFNINYNTSDKENSIRELLADIIADIVINNLEKELIDNIIDNYYDKFNENEKSEIKKYSFQHLNNTSKNLTRLVRKEEIISQLINYLDNNKELNIEGFARFRLKSYIDELELAVQKAVDDFVIEEEYNEFLDLLRYFVDLQEPEIDLINVIKLDETSFQLLDSEKKPVKDKNLEKCIEELTKEENIEFIDLLISALINISPARILLHFDDENIEKTLNNIFGENIFICEGCSLCQEKVKT